MSQEEILKILKENKNNWYTSKELSLLTGKNTVSVTKNMGKLAKLQDIKYKSIRTGRYHRLIIKFKEDTT
jgi:hypothetical protein